MVQENIVSMRNVTFTYREASKPAVVDLNLDIPKGSWVSIIGHNGSGKSTITRLIDGLIASDNLEKSKIFIDGVELTPETVWDLRKQIGIVFQNPDNQFVGATVADDVAFGLENRGIARPEMVKRVAQALKDVGMDDYAKTEPSNLSGGQKQRVAIAGILAVHPQIIILDEATSMLDPEGRDDILNIVREMQKRDHLTVISITHDINAVNNSDLVAVVDDGKLLAYDQPDKIFSHTKLLREIGLDVPFFYQVRVSLAAAGVSVPSSISSEEELVNYLCQLNSKM